MDDAPIAAPSAPEVRARGGKPLLVVVLLVVLLTLCWWAWQRWFAVEPTEPAAPAPLAVPPNPVSDPGLAVLREQLADHERVSNVLRQQVLALTERVRVLGDQVTALQQAPAATPATAPGPTPMLALAEQWLELAQARFDLFADVRGALNALEAADRVLAQARDPRVLSLRQTLAIEREALRTLPQADTMTVSGQLLAWQQASGGWPLRRDGTSPAADSEPGNGWLTRLDRYFQVRRLEPDAAPLRLADGRSLVAAELAWARQLLVRGESAELQRTLQRTAELVGELFENSDEGVATALEGMRGLAARLVTPTSAVQLGTSLSELRSFHDQTAPAAMTARPLPTPPAEREAPPPETPEIPIEPAAAGSIDPGMPP